MINQERTILLPKSNAIEEPTPKNSEESVRRALMLKVASMYGLNGEVASSKADYVINNLATLKKLAQAVGYYYGIPPHRMVEGLIHELIKVGEKFFQGSSYEGDNTKYLDAGIDIFKTISVDIDSPDFQEWNNYVSSKTRLEL